MTSTMLAQHQINDGLFEVHQSRHDIVHAAVLVVARDHATKQVLDPGGIESLIIQDSPIQEVTSDV